MSYAVEISSKGTKLFSSPLRNSQMNYLHNEFSRDQSISKISCYFPRTAQSMKIQNFIKKIFSTIKAFFIDLMTLPFNYQNYRNALRKELFIYDYLNRWRVPSKYLNTDFFDIAYYHKVSDKIDEERQSIRVNSHIGLKRKIIDIALGGKFHKNVSDVNNDLFIDPFCIE